MKNIYFYLLLICPTCFIAQTTEVFTGLLQPICLKKQGSEVFFSEFNTGKIFKFNIEDPNPVLEELLSGLTNPSSIVPQGDLLYFTTNGGIPKKISVADLSTMPPAITDIIIDNVEPNEIILYGDILYVTSFSDNKISKIDLSATNPVLEDIISGLGGSTYSLLKGNDLYIVEAAADKISKIDITNPNPVPEDVFTGLDRPNHILIVGDDMIITEYGGGKILKMNLTLPNPTPEIIISNLDGPTDIVLIEGDPFYEMYISEYDSGKILKLTTEIVSTEELIQGNRLLLFPNPSQDYFQIKNLEEDLQGDIFDFNGRKIKSVSLKQNTNFDITELPAGAYYIRTENGTILKFTKVKY